MGEAELAGYLIALVTCLGTCLVWALHEIEEWRQRSRHRKELVREARKFATGTLTPGRREH